MKKGTHGINEETFAKLSYSGQAKSINAQVLSIERALKAHITRAKEENKDVSEMKSKYKMQLERLIKDLSN